MKIRDVTFTTKTFTVYLNGTLALQITNDMRHTVLWRNSQ